MPSIFSGRSDEFLCAGYNSWAKAADVGNRLPVPRHKSPIEDQLRDLRGFVEAGFPADHFTGMPEFQLMAKAFRLKHFGRCPACDQCVTFWHDQLERTRHGKCLCGWRAEVTDWELMAADHPDDVIIELCRKTLAGKEAKP